jgi:uncharacterized membrane protein YidH (DUF202 family)
MGFGVVIAKFNLALSTPGSAEMGDAVKASHLGLAFALAGVATIVMSLVMFLENRKQIRNRNYQSRVGLVLTLTATTTVLGVMVLWHLTHTLPPGTH